MKNLRWLPLFLVMLATPCGAADELTASDLSRQLEVKSWVSKVTLPPGSFSAVVLHVVDGKIAEPLAGGLVGSSDEATGQRIVIMCGPSGGGGKVTLLIGRAQAFSNPSPNIPLPVTIALPEAIEEGDYCLGGRYPMKGEAVIVSTGIDTLEDGLLLRVKKTNYASLGHQ